MNTRFELDEASLVFCQIWPIITGRLLFELVNGYWCYRHLDMSRDGEPYESRKEQMH